jgi:hypothetical protein
MSFSFKKFQSVCHEMAGGSAVDYALNFVGIHQRFVLRGINADE